MLYPLTFHPILKERIWGGRNLATLFGKSLPSGRHIGESWEISDRPDPDPARSSDVSLIANGPLAGKSLRWLMEHHRTDLIGEAAAPGGRFPLLVKILDAKDRLSLQVHPPPAVARQLGGEPKTEMWYIVHAEPEAMLYAGLKHGISRAEFERHLNAGSVEQCFHGIPVKDGDTLFLPSGRVHAIGAGNVIFEVQQNSDTTYRVFDWNRPDTDGKLRQLHIPESLASIDFNDFEPEPIRCGNGAADTVDKWLVDAPLFRVMKKHLIESHTMPVPRVPVVAGIIAGHLEIESGGIVVSLKAGQFCLLPACLQQVQMKAKPSADLLWAEAGRSGPE